MVVVRDSNFDRRGSSDPVQPLALPILGADLNPIDFADGCRDSGYENKDFVRMEMRTKLRKHLLRKSIR